MTPQSQAADETIYAYWGGPGSSFNGTIKVRFNQPGVDYTVEVKAVPPQGGSGEFMFNV